MSSCSCGSGGCSPSATAIYSGLRTGNKALLSIAGRTVLGDQLVSLADLKNLVNPSSIFASGNDCDSRLPGNCWWKFATCTEGAFPIPKYVSGSDRPGFRYVSA